LWFSGGEGLLVGERRLEEGLCGGRREMAERGDSQREEARERGEVRGRWKKRGANDRSTLQGNSRHNPRRLVRRHPHPTGLVSSPLCPPHRLPSLPPRLYLAARRKRLKKPHGRGSDSTNGREKELADCGIGHRDRDWQKWPVTIVTGAYIGWAVGRWAGMYWLWGRRIEFD